jgi:hypothetical protein
LKLNLILTLTLKVSEVWVEAKEDDYQCLRELLKKSSGFSGRSSEIGGERNSETVSEIGSGSSVKYIGNINISSIGRCDRSSGGCSEGIREKGSCSERGSESIEKNSGRRRESSEIINEKSGNLQDLMEALIEELNTLEASSYYTLQALISMSKARSRVDKIKNRREKMGDLLSSTFINNDIRLSGRETYKSGYNQGWNDHGLNDQGWNDQGWNDQGWNDQGWNDLGCNDQGWNDKKQGWNDQRRIGACLLRHCPFGEFVSKVEKGVS